jgi:uncharacterized membrane protein (UPF0127 family)
MDCIKIFFKGKKIKIFVKKVSFFGKIFGLMFKKCCTNNLLFEFANEGRRAIHSFFLRFSFLAIWLDSKNNVVEFRIVKPFCFCVRPKQKFRRLIEVPFNNNNKRIIDFFVGKRKI